MSKPSLLSLPDELQVEILNSLPYPDAQNLAAVDKYHRTLINLDAIRDKVHSANLLHQLHTAKQSNPFYSTYQVCCDCLRLRPDTKFTTSLGNKYRIATNLFCDDCGNKGNEAIEAWCKQCKELSWRPQYGFYDGDRNCVRNGEVLRLEGFRVPGVGDYGIEDPFGRLRPPLECPLSRREEWCFMNRWMLE